MLFIDNQGIHDPAINLAIEEYALKHLPLDDSYLLFYINQPSIIIGKHQNTIEEINAEFVRDNNIQVVRRLSGGGAVYHDLGNLNFSFITRDNGESFHNFLKFTQPVIDALRQMGVEAEMTGRNDLQVGERKISGNAQFATRGRMFSHGTLMFNLNLDNVAASLHANPEKFKSKSTKSVRSRVANISELMDREMTIEQFREELLRFIFGAELDQVPQYKLTDTDWAKIHEISKERYQSWDWNYGLSPRAISSTHVNFRSALLISAWILRKAISVILKSMGISSAWVTLLILKISCVASAMMEVRYVKPYPLSI